MKIVCPNRLFNVLMNRTINPEKYQEEFLDFMMFNENSLILLNMINEFKTIGEMYVTTTNPYIWAKSPTYTPSMITPNHRLAIWEILKFIMSHYKTIYSTLKKMDTFVLNKNTKSHNTTSLSGCQITDDDDIDLYEDCFSMFNDNDMF